jgi:hypothetical protein
MEDIKIDNLFFNRKEKQIEDFKKEAIELSTCISKFNPNEFSLAKMIQKIEIKEDLEEKGDLNRNFFKIYAAFIGGLVMTFFFIPFNSFIGICLIIGGILLTAIVTKISISAIKDYQKKKQQDI